MTIYVVFDFKLKHYKKTYDYVRMPTSLQNIFKLKHFKKTIDQACVIIRCKNLALNIRDCVSLCLSEETLKAVGPFYLVSMPGEVKDPTSLHWKCVTCGLHILT